MLLGYMELIRRALVVSLQASVKDLTDSASFQAGKPICLYYCFAFFFVDDWEQR